MRIAGIAVGAAVAASCGGSREPETKSLPDTGSVAVEGAQLPFRVVGTGRPCLVFGSHIYYPRTFSENFDRALRCAHVDQRGFLNSPPDGTAPAYSVDVAIADIERARIALGLDRPILVGHSMHGTVVLAYALAHPDKVAGVVSIGAPPGFDTTLTMAGAAYWGSFASEGRKAFDERSPLRLSQDSLGKLTPGAAFIATYIGNSARYWADSSFDASGLWAGVTANPGVIFQLFDMRKPYQLPEAPADGRPPVFLALGRFDFVVPPTLWDGRGRAFPQLTKQIFERSGHTPQLEEAAAFDQALLEWVARLR